MASFDPKIVSGLRLFAQRLRDTGGGGGGGGAAQSSDSSSELYHTYWNDTLRRKTDREAKNEPKC